MIQSLRPPVNDDHRRVTTLNLLSNTSCVDGDSLKKRPVLGEWSTTLSGGSSMSDFTFDSYLAISCVQLYNKTVVSECQSYCTTLAAIHWKSRDIRGNEIYMVKVILKGRKRAG